MAVSEQIDRGNVALLQVVGPKALRESDSPDKCSPERLFYRRFEALDRKTYDRAGHSSTKSPLFHRPQYEASAGGCLSEWDTAVALAPTGAVAAGWSPHSESEG